MKATQVKLILLAVFVLANLAIFIPRFMKGVADNSLVSSEVRARLTEWEAAKSLLDVPIRPWQGPSEQVTLALRPARDKQYRYVIASEMPKQDMISLVSGQVEVTSIGSDAIKIMATDEDCWMLERGRVSAGRGAATSEFIVKNGSARPVNDHEAPLTLFAVDTFTPGLASYTSQQKVQLGSQWRGKGETLGEPAEYQVVGYAEVGPWKTIILTATHNLDPGYAEARKRNEKSQSNKAVPDLLLKTLNQYSQKESCKLYVDVETGMLVRREAKMTLTPRNALGTGSSITTTYQLAEHGVP